MITHFCIIGERVSGTCFLQSLISTNTGLKNVADFGHKHFFQDTDKLRASNTAHILFLFITRDVVDWLNSICVNSFHADIPLRNCTNFSKFVRMEWKCIEDETSGVTQLSSAYGKEMMHERDPSTGERFENVIKMRTSKIVSAMSIRNIVETFIHVKYEDVRDNPKDFIRDICIFCGIHRREKFIGINTIRGKGKVEYRPKVYPEISEDDREFILNQIDQEVESAIGYM